MTSDQIRAIESAVEELIAGKVNTATARLNAKLGLRATGAGDLSDESDWLDDIIDTNVGLRCGWKNYKADSRKPIVDRWPAQELFGAGPERDARDWTSLWLQNGGRLFTGLRMIALRDNPIWSAISDFDLPFSPFAKASRMRTRLIDRDEANVLGLIDRDRQIALPHVNWNGALLVWEPEDRPKE